MALTAHQEQKMADFIQLCIEGHKRIVLKGSAGVGKTFMTQEIIKVLKSTLYKYGAVYITAPTHKALRVLMTKIEPKPYIIFQTIHSALQIERYIDKETGTEHFRQKKINEKYPPFKGAQVVMVDESSMLNRELMGYIDKYPNLLFIYIGDDKQLNPVGEEYSPVFLGREIDFDFRGMPVGWEEYPTVELTEVVRQGAGNPIIELSRNLDLLINLGNSTRVNKLLEDNLGYAFDNNQDYIVDKLAEVNGTDDLKYTAWTNPVCDFVNGKVRERLYGERPMKVEVGESIVFNAPFKDYTTNQELKILTVEIRDIEIIVPNEATRYAYSEGIPILQRRFDEQGVEIRTYDLATVKVYWVNEELPILHETEQVRFGKMLQEIIIKCQKKLIPWHIKYIFAEQFVDFTYNHAITIHKSQGSTFQKSIVNVKNVLLNSKRPLEMQRLLYTGVTRAAKTLILFNT